MKYKKITYLLFVIGIIIIIIGSIFILKEKKIIKKGDKPITVNVSNINNKIADLILKEYEEEDFDNLDKDKIIIKYNKDNNEFRIEYTFDEAEKTIYTTDFVVYNTSITTYEEDGTPYSSSFSDSQAISNSTKLKIQELAQKAGYKTGKLLTNKQYDEILNILKESEMGKYIKEIEDNNYNLKTVTSVEKEYIRYYYSFGQKYGEIKCAYNDSKIWNINITSDIKLDDDYTINEDEDNIIYGKYELDKLITLNETEHEKIKDIISDYLDE